MKDYEVITTESRLRRICDEIEKAPVLGGDLETTSSIISIVKRSVATASSMGLFDADDTEIEADEESGSVAFCQPFDGKIRIVSLNTGSHIYIVDTFLCKNVDCLVSALKNNKGIKIFQNAKYDQKWALYHFGWEIFPVFDPFRASRLIYNGKKDPNGKPVSCDLWSLLRRELGIEPSGEDLGGSNWGGKIEEKQYSYCADDVRYLPALRDKLKPQLAKWGLNKVAALEFGVVLPEAAIENTGLYIDTDRWLAQAKARGEEAKKLGIELLYELPHPRGQGGLPGLGNSWNLDSHDQLLLSLRRLGLKNDKGPLVDTSEMELAQWAAQFPVISKILSYREASKSESAFGAAYLEHISKTTKRVHASFFGFTGAGRYACSRPNLAQLPRSAVIRDCIRAEEGYTLTSADYSTGEMRAGAHIAPDAALQKLFGSHKDPHRVTAAITARIKEDQVTKEQRQRAKAVNFGFLFGMGFKKFILYALSQYKVVFSEQEAKSTRDRFFAEYKGLKRWHNHAVDEATAAGGMVRTPLGRLRYLNPQNDYSALLNTPVQGCVADGFKLALRNVYERLKKYNGDSRMVHHVHDEILVESKSDPELVKAVEKDLQDGMIEALSSIVTSVPIEVEAKSGASWKETK